MDDDRTGRQAKLPTGTVTFLFTDIEGSTRLLAEFGDRYAGVLEWHAGVLRHAIAEHGGTEVGTEGDSFFAAFPSAIEAIAAVVDAQRALAAGRQADRPAVRVRMGVHTGEGRTGGEDYVGLDVHRAARIAAAGHGDQVLMSDATRALIADDLPGGAHLRDLGQHRLKDLPEPQHIWQLDIDGLRDRFPAIRSLDAHRGNLPRWPTPMIGRDAEVAVIVALLSSRPLVTLIGPGGIGKTRLALAVAEMSEAAFGDGVFFVALQDARDRDAVAAAVAEALGVRETLDRDLARGVEAYLRDRNVLLVLDNFEQVLGAAPFVGGLLAASPDMRVIVTSRVVLRLASEQLYEVAALPVPEPRGQSISTLAESAAIALFVERARAVRPSFELEPSNATAVAEICRRVDGLPLAIELAAARVRFLAPDAILERLDQRLLLLVGGAADLPTRQQTLRGTIDWSYDLLDAPERRLFERLAAFAGGWTIDAAEAVADPASEIGMDTLEGLGSLADKSLIVAREGGGGESRFTMLQVIRESAAERLHASPDGDTIRRRHAVYFMTLAENAEPHLRSADLRAWQALLRREQDNLRAAMRWSMETGDAEVGLRLAGSIWDYWHYWAEIREGVRWLADLLALPGATAPTTARAKALRGFAGLVYWQGDAERASLAYDEALVIARDLGDERQVAALLFDSAWAAVGRGDLKGALERAREARDRYRGVGDERRATVTSAWMDASPVIMGFGGEIDAAVQGTVDAIEANRSMGLSHEVADWLEARAMIYRAVGDADQADEISRETLREWHALGTIGRYPLSFKLLAAVALRKKQGYRAARLGAAAERFNREIGGELSDVIAQLGDPVEDSRSLVSPGDHDRAVEEGRTLGLDDQIAYALETDSTDT